MTEFAQLLKGRPRVQTQNFGGLPHPAATSPLHSVHPETAKALPCAVHLLPSPAKTFLLPITAIPTSQLITSDHESIRPQEPGGPGRCVGLGWASLSQVYHRNEVPLSSPAWVRSPPPFPGIKSVRRLQISPNILPIWPQSF